MDMAGSGFNQKKNLTCQKAVIPPSITNSDPVQ